MKAALNANIRHTKPISLSMTELTGRCVPNANAKKLMLSASSAGVTRRLANANLAGWSDS